MNFILNQKYSGGNTPIRPEEAEQLIPRISTMGELNEYEALNILRAREWALDCLASLLHKAGGAIPS
jgi:hypothetical protein